MHIISLYKRHIIGPIHLFMRTCFRRVIVFYIEFGVPKGSIHELCMFMKKYKLVHRTIFLNIIDFLSYHATHAKSEKRHLGQPLCNI
jgi:hypothetical protein